MAKVIRHEAKDGTLFATAKECEAHNRTLRLQPVMQAFVNSIDPKADEFTEVAGGAIVVFQGDLPFLLVKHADALKKALAEAEIVRRPRKPKEAKLKVGERAPVFVPADVANVL